MFCVYLCVSFGGVFFRVGFGKECCSWFLPPKPSSPARFLDGAEQLMNHADSIHSNDDFGAAEAESKVGVTCIFGVILDFFEDEKSRLQTIVAYIIYNI